MYDLVTRPTEDLAKRVYVLATQCWFRLVNTPGGHHGVMGPAGSEPDDWTLTKGYLGSAVTALEQVLTPPDPIQVLHDLFEAGHLDGHHYDIRESEGKGWYGPRMVKWGEACAQARELLKITSRNDPEFSRSLRFIDRDIP